MDEKHHHVHPEVRQRIFRMVLENQANSKREGS